MYDTHILPVLKRLINVAFDPKHLLWTNVTISGITYGTADFVQQVLEKVVYKPKLAKPKPHQWKTTWNMALAGTVNGVIFHFWYRMLDRRIPGRTAVPVVIKILLDQIIGSPTSITSFLISMAILEGKTYEDFLDDVKSDWIPLYISEWVVWPAAQYINFYYVPSRFRLLYVNGISLCSDVYKSHIKSTNALEKADKHKPKDQK